MPCDEVLCSWLVRSALASLAILLIGSGAVLVWRQPARRVRIIELVLAGCLTAPWLGMIPGYPQLTVVTWHAAAIKPQETPLPRPVEPVLESAIPEPMPFLVPDRDTPPAPSTKTIEPPATLEAPVHAFDVRSWIVGVYFLGVAIGAGWGLVGIAGLVRILWTSRPAPSRCRELLAEISAGRSGRVRLLVSRRLSQPFASAWGRAVIVLPENLCGDEQSLRWCLAHEWAHIDRHDFRTWLLAGLARVLFFYQPLLWWLRRQLRLCQDFVADAQAALQARQVEDYAEFLTARVAAGRLHPAVIGLSMGCHKSELYRRVIMLLKNESLERRTPRIWTVSVTVAALVLVAVVAAVSLVPRAVAEEKSAVIQSEERDGKDQPATKEGAKTESKTVATIDQISAAWRTRQERVRSARLELTETELIPAGAKPPLGMFPGTKKESTGAKREPLPRTDISVECARTVLLSGRMLRMNREGSYWHPARAEVEEHKYISSFDGEVAKCFYDEKSIGELGGFILKDARNQDFDNYHYLPIALAFRPCDLDMGGRDLAKYTVNPGMQTIDGRAYVVITGNPRQSSYETLWLDPQRDFLVVRARDESGNSTTFDISYQKDSSFGWVPSEWKWIARGGNSGRLFGQAVAKVTTYTINTDIPKAAFQFEFPVGTYVSDLRTEDIERYIVRQGGKKRIITKEEIRRGAGADYKELLSTESGMARGKSADQSGKTSTAKPAVELSPASDQPATKEGPKTESKPISTDGLTAEPTTEQAKAIAEIEKLGGKVTIDEKRPDKPAISVSLHNTQVSDAELKHVRALTMLQSLTLAGSTKVTDAGLAHLEGLTNLQTLDLTNTQVSDAGLEHLKGLTQLKSLNLWGTMVTDAGLEHLKGLTRLQALNLQGRWRGFPVHSAVTDAGLLHLKGLTKLESLDLPWTEVTDAGLEQLKGLTNLQSLNLSNTKVAGAGLVHIRGLTRLQALNLEQTQVTDAGLAQLKGLTNLQSLELGQTQVTDAGLAQLKGLTNLQSLSLYGTKVTDAGLERLKGATTLQSLDLMYTKVTDAGLEHLTSWNRLQSLNLGGTEVTDAGLANLKGMTTLQVLFLDQTRVTDAGLIHLEGLTQLQKLGLYQTRVTDAGLVHIQGLTKLQALNLASTKVSDAGLEQLKGLPNLRALALVRTKVTDAGLVTLKGLTRLQELNLEETDVSDAGLERLKGWSQLQSLNLEGTKVTDAGLEHLKGLNQLQSLNLLGTKVTDAGVKGLQKALPPTCTIMHR